MIPFIRMAGMRAVVAAVATLVVSAGWADAHGPDPMLGAGLWSPNEVAAYRWASSGVPPSWMATAIDAGAVDVGQSRGSRAAVFLRSASGSATIAYGGWVPCDSYGIACMDRSGLANNVFGVWFRPYGWAFDWGSLRWCQGMSTPTNGCYDAENVALDELGHVEILGHHVNYSDESDFGDAVVQYAARARARTGWNQHIFGRCDIARLQLEYARGDAADSVSTCLSLATTTSLAANTTSIWVGDSMRFSATLKITSSAAAEALAGDLLSNRTVILQRRTIGSTSWASIRTLTPSTTIDGSYSYTWAPTVTADWRAVFSTPSGEGLLGSTSGIIRVTVDGCLGSGCPVMPVAG
jgi:hypothetical protein